MQAQVSPPCSQGMVCSIVAAGCVGGGRVASCSSPSRISTRWRSLSLGSWAVVWCRWSQSSTGMGSRSTASSGQPVPPGSRRLGPGSRSRQVPYPPSAAMLMPDELLTPGEGPRAGSPDPGGVVGAGRRARLLAIWRTVARGRPGVTGLAAAWAATRRRRSGARSVPAFVGRVWRSRGRGGARRGW